MGNSNSDTSLPDDPRDLLVVRSVSSTRMASQREKETVAELIQASGTKFDAGKPRMDLLPPVSLERISQVLGFGAVKYDQYNWQKGIAYSRLIGAALRHLFAFMRGEDNDKESGMSHLAHAGCCILFLIWMTEKRSDLDDRSKEG